MPFVAHATPAYRGSRTRVRSAERPGPSGIRQGPELCKAFRPHSQQNSWRWGLPKGGSPSGSLCEYPPQRPLFNYTRPCMQHDAPALHAILPGSPSPSGFLYSTPVIVQRETDPMLPCFSAAPPRADLTPRCILPAPRPSPPPVMAADPFRTARLHPCRLGSACAVVCSVPVVCVLVPSLSGLWCVRF